ncbi:hypothetical protein [Thiocystis violacea]|uniref:hypothetical protein n=1 Tax=Thiocystis violacea TaxID=13725 RepID=UPI0019075FD0|nr:hypothetical protein [Thiocystis violacea]
MIAVLSDQALQRLVDRLLFEQGRFEPVELLLAADLLAYEDYEAWRTGRIADLQGALRAAPTEVAEALRRAAEYARRQKLEATSLDYRGWGAEDRRLAIGPDKALTEASSQQWAPAADRAQFDLFHDSSALLIEAAISRALAERRLDDAREKTAQLMRENPRHPRLSDFLRLIQAVDELGRYQPSAGPREQLVNLEAVEPVARGVLGHLARDFLAGLWAALAERLGDRPFEPAAFQLHASHAWARAGRWEAVRASVEAAPAWGDQPRLLTLHAEAAWRRHDLATARRDWMWLCWEHPVEAERALGSASFPDPWLARLWRGFRDLHDPLDTEDFPAWLLLHESIGTAHLPADEAPPDERGEAYRLLDRLAHGDGDIALRRQLDETHPALLRAFLARI